MEHSWDTDAATALKDVLLGSSKSDASFVLIAGKSFSRQVRRFLGASRSVVVFDAARNGSRLDQVITRARQVTLRPRLAGCTKTVCEQWEYCCFLHRKRYTFRRPPDGSWGVKRLDGTFTGMVGQVYKKEADVGLGPFALNAPRLEAVDFLWPISLMPVKVFAGLGSVEVDPWGFVLPFGMRVWVALLALLFLLSFGSCFLSSKLSEEDFSDEGKPAKDNKTIINKKVY
ncbi:Glutamate receptor U1 [Portunus trituberculatus]|uniref:Glutamate receptor U1 n=1 Tax=Portunus trituberculatus TaxID=210409 RepID=A0A5B7CX60_PORTR|nr:Glutamate receptor U1 [Portunus trituberculatus]